MSKKLCSVFILLTLLISCLPLAALGADISVNDVKVQDNQVTVNGNAPAGDWVALTVHKDNGKTAYLGQTRADSEGAYSFVFTLDRGKYSAKLVSGAASAEVNISVVTDYNGNPATPPSGPGGDPAGKYCYLKVTGSREYGTILPQTRWVWSSGSPNVITVLKAVLDENDIDYEITAGGYVKSIGGLSEKAPGYPLSGWNYKVNGDFPPVGAESCPAHDDDNIEWLYTLDGGKDIGAPSSISDSALIAVDELALKQQMDAYAGMMDIVGTVPVVLNSDRQMTHEQALKLKDLFDLNPVSIDSEVGNEGAFLYDSTGEFMVWIPENALEKDLDLTIRERSSADFGDDTTLLLSSGIYDFQPDGTYFNHPVIIAIQIGITGDMHPKNLTPAHYDPESEKWVPLPGIIDLENGWVVFKVEHLCNFAVIEAKSQPELIRISFPDVGPEYDWARDAIEIMAGKGIIKGTDLGFEPQRNINRAEMASLLVNIRQLSKECFVNHGFSDVKESDWFVGAVTAAADEGMMSGYPEGTFKPYKPISRYEAAVILYRLQTENGSIAVEPTAGEFTDNLDIPLWASDGVAFVRNSGLMNGYQDGSFQGMSPLSRAETAVILYRYLQMTE